MLSASLATDCMVRRDSGFWSGDNWPLMEIRFGPVGWALTAIFALLVVVAGTLAWVFALEQSAQSQAIRTSRSIESLLSAQVALLNAETGQRGYLLTGDPAYLESYNRGLRDFPEAVENMRRTMLRLPNAATEIAELSRLANQKIDELARTIATFDTGDRAGALALVRTDAGKTAMDDFHSRIQRMRAIENQLLETANADVARASLASSVLLGVLALAAIVGAIAGVEAIRRTERSAALERYTQSLELANERATLLSQELNHRVKNIFAIVGSIVSTTARHESDVDVAAEKMRARIVALAHAHGLTSGGEAHGSVNLADLAEAVVGAQAGEDQARSITGADLPVARNSVTPLGMVLHELATNATKYGAWSAPGGAVDLAWSVEGAGSGGRLLVDWREILPEGAPPPPPGQHGFGSRMIEMSMQQLDGAISREWGEKGLSVHMAFPLSAIIGPTATA